VAYRVAVTGRSFVPAIAAIRDWGSADLGGNVRQAEAAQRASTVAAKPRASTGSAPPSSRQNTSQYNDGD
jgi:hypothetical protein